MRIVLTFLLTVGLFNPAHAEPLPRCTDGLMFDNSPMADASKTAVAFWQAATVQTVTRCFATSWSVTGDRDGMTALHYAVKNNAAPEIIKAIIDAGVDVDARARGWTPLWFAVQQTWGDPEIVRMLIAAGADVNAPNLAVYEDGEWSPNSPLDLAWVWQTLGGPIISMLLAAGAK